MGDWFADVQDAGYGREFQGVRLMKLREVTAVAAMATFMAATGVAAAETLTIEGAELPAAAFAPGGALEARVDAGGDEVLSVHTVLNPASSTIYWMRDRDGFWAPWNGQMDDLVESAAVEDGGELVFKIFDTPPADVPSMTISIAYRTAEGLKFGWFQAAEQAE